MHDGPKRRGRFIKKDSMILEHIVMQDFSFDEIRPQPIIVPDNTSRNIIHSSYHEPTQLTAATKIPEQFNQDLMAGRERSQILFPFDFAEDWERGKTRGSNTPDHLDTEDFYYQEAMESARKRSQQSSQSVPNGKVTSEDSPHKSAVSRQRDSNLTEISASAAKADDAAAAMHAAGFRFQKNDTAENLQSQAPNPVDSESEVKFAEHHLDPDSQSNQPALAKQSEAESAQFIPLESAESNTSEEYRRRLLQKEFDEKERGRLEDDAKAHGYREGFRIGEEKGAMVARHNATELFGRVSELINELAGLKRLILHSVQDNFYEICQAMAEALFRREFSIQPEAFVAVIKRAIDEAVEPGKIRVHVHPETYDRIVALGLSDMTQLLVKDQGIEVADFKIESDQSVIDANLSKIIADFLNQADLSLMDEDETKPVINKQDAG